MRWPVNFLRAITLAGIALAAALADVDAQSARRQADLPLDPSLVTLRRGDASGFSSEVRIVVRDSATWAWVWDRFQAPFREVAAEARAAYPVPPLPPIDFSREMLVLAALGLRTAWTEEIVIDSVAASPERPVIRAVVTRLRPAQSPGVACGVSAAGTWPVHVVRVPRSDKPVEFVERRSELLNCGNGPRHSPPDAPAG